MIAVGYLVAVRAATNPMTVHDIAAEFDVPLEVAARAVEYLRRTE